MMRLVRAGAIGTLWSGISTSHHVPCLLRVSYLSRLAWNCIHEWLSWMVTLLRALMHHHGCAPTRAWKSAVWLLRNVLRIDMSRARRVHWHLWSVLLRHQIRPA